VLIAPADIRKALAKGFDEIEGFSTQFFAYDGRMGHAIALMSHNPESRTFHFRFSRDFGARAQFKYSAAVTPVLCCSVPYFQTYRSTVMASATVTSSLTSYVPGLRRRAAGFTLVLPFTTSSCQRFANWCAGLRSREF
jgi:hypothetical protein